jgi:hypothetical protein
MQGNNAQFEGGRELPYLDMKDSYLGSFLRRTIAAVNQLATNAGVAAVGKTAPPPSIDSIQVKGALRNGVITAPGELLHWTLTHNQSINKGVRYFSEIDTDPNFTQPHVIDHGASRTGLLHLPTLLDDNSTVQTYYMRSYAQYPGSDPSKPTVLGNLGGAIGIRMSGTTATTLLPSTGSGTANVSGQQGGKGLGTVLQRPAPQAKRQAKKF